MDRQSGKTWSIVADGAVLLTSANNGKEKSKTLAGEEEARRQAEKEIWSRLKKGFMYYNPEASAGAPVLHLYRGPGYTGFMPLAASPDTNSIYTAYVVGQFEQTELVRFSEQGEREAEHILEGSHMLYRMSWDTARNELLYNDSHQMGRVDLAAGTFHALSGEAMPNDYSLAAGRAVWREGDSLLVTELETNRILLTLPIEPELYGGHSPQLAVALSPDGSRLAVCTHSDVIVVHQVEGGEPATLVKSVPAMSASLSFSSDGRVLYSQERYGSWDLIAFDLESAHEVGWRLPDVMRTSFDPARGRIGVCRYRHMEVYDDRTRELLLSFPLEHVVKTAELAFTRDYAAVYTDYGCISLYKL